MSSGTSKSPLFERGLCPRNPALGEVSEGAAEAPSDRSSGLAAFVPIVVVPVFNEAETIGEVVAAARAHAPVLVVDDGSDDGSAAAARAAGAEVLRHPRRLGKGQAIRTGVAAARSRRASVVVTLDGDGQHDPGDLTAVLGAARGAPRAIVVGSRLAEAGVLPPDRLNAIRVAGFFVNWASGLKLEDTQSGYRAYPVTLFDEVELRHGGFVLETEVLIAAAARGWQVREVPVQAIPRARRRSRFRPLGDGAAIGAYLAGRVVARGAVGAAAVTTAELYAVVVVGGGPAGSTAGAFLAQAGRRVLLVEREPFPRFHVGESLLPATLPILDRLGVHRAIAERGFQVKYGATFHDQESGLEHTFYFLRDKPWPSYAYQVPRADFDALLLEHAQKLGVEVRQPATVESVALDRKSTR